MSKSNSSGCGTVIFLIIVMVMISLLAKGCQFANDLIGTDEEEKKAKSTVVVDGQNGYLIQNAFVAIDKESFDELISYYVADNGDAIIRMMENGRVFAGSKGEKVTVIDSGFTQSYIEIVSTGMRGYVESELVRSKIEE
ncbi:hypothetical protein [Psychrobacillus sp. OK032]|uniref:hypothetical protein n=1 Tax=Psychrobacillus sp. OK032 TaxID=1884358 RepID=UPI0008C89088|nr:hypothetical protein [Psychrobacillus sp. OK032]SES17751.1 hypothetical protein SAMN05518872_105120 [Psychrobacillus sp. OK032]